jgi:hypothetical protein
MVLLISARYLSWEQVMEQWKRNRHRNLEVGGQVEKDNLRSSDFLVLEDNLYHSFIQGMDNCLVQPAKQEDSYVSP